MLIMSTHLLQQFLSLFKSKSETKPDPEFVAGQLRKPSGKFAPQVGENMNYVNETLFDLTLEAMQLQDEESVLEIGFGTGKFFPKIFAEAKDLQVRGIDFSEEMVELAKTDNRKELSGGALDIRWGRSNDIPFPNRTFDKVFCNMVIYFWDRAEPHLNEIHRVLKPEGRFYTGFRTRDSMLAFPFVKYGFNLYEEDEWEKILNRNGFSVKESIKKVDPELEFEGEIIRLESCCVVAEKNEVPTIQG